MFMIKRLLSTKLVLVFLLSLLSFSGKTYASHYAATDLYVTYVGKCPGEYLYDITFILYRACENGATFSAPLSNFGPKFNYIDSGNGGSVIQMDMDTIGPFQVVADLCPSYFPLNSCANPGNNTWPAFEKWTFSSKTAVAGYPNGVPLLPSTNWTFFYTSGARNGGILNGFANQNLYTECMLNNSTRANVSTPRFGNDPDPYFCLNNLNIFPNGAYDPDNDSIHVTNVPPLGTSAANVLAYGAGYSLANPISSSTPYIVDPRTGNATFTPTKSGKFVLCFRCDKIDRASGTLLGFTRRDVQVTVLTCSSPPPNSDPTPSVSTGLIDSNIVTICPGATGTFNIGGHSTATGNQVYLSADPNRPLPLGASFTVPTTGANSQGSSNPIGIFSWTPSNCDIGLHEIIITATDSSCNSAQPILARAQTLIYVNVISGLQVLPKTLGTCKFSPPISVNCSGPANISYQWTNIDGSQYAIVGCSTCQTLNANPKYSTQYIVHSTTLDAIGGCKSRDTVTVNMDTITHIKISPASPVVICKPGILEFTATGSGQHPLTNMVCSIPYTSPAPATIKDSTSVIPRNSRYTACTLNDSIISPLGGFKTERHQYLIKGRDMRYSGMKPGTISGVTFNVSSNTPANSTYLGVHVSIACTTQGLPGTGAPATMPATSLVAQYTSLSVSGTGDLYIPFTVDYNPATQKYFDWDTSMDILLSICYDNVIPGGKTPQATFVSYYNTNYPSCNYGLNCDSTIPGMCANTAAVAAPIYELPAIRFTYFYSPASNFAYQWTTAYGDRNIVDTTLQTVSMYVTRDSKYYAITQGLGGCIVRDSVSVSLDHPPAWKAYPRDTAICIGRTTMLWAVNGTKYAWFENANGVATLAITLTDANGLPCNICATPYATPKDTTIYDVVISDIYNCTDTIYLTVNTIPLPNFHVNSKELTVKYGSSVQLGVNTNIYSYIWAPISTLDNPYKTNPIATPWEPTQYIVTGFNGNCSSSDTVNVNIDYSANLFVPSAFTPNGDGQNDVFRVGNLTFQKIIEFRVLNRWGNEIYHALDNHGWDGSWNGIRQDVGIYYYLIRVESLDGTIQTFTGDVTLIR